MCTSTEPPAFTVNGVFEAVIVKTGAVCTTRLRGEEVEVVNAVLPEYTAVMLFVPAVKLLLVRVAIPHRFTGEVPRSVKMPE